MPESICIKIGLLQYTPAWELVLDQIGVSWSLIQEIHTLTPTSHSLVIVNKSISSNEQSVLSNYSNSGGALLYTPEEKQQVERRSVRKKYISSLVPQQKEEYSFFEIFDIYNRAFLFKDNSLLEVEHIRGGLLSYLGLSIDPIVLNSKSKRKSFFTESKRFPNERVARTSKNALRQLLQSHFEYLHHRRNLPFVHKWFYPTDKKSIFTFRVDSDKGTKEQIEEIYHISQMHKIPTTWFLDVKSHEAWLDYFTKFTEQEIGVHCYHHIIYNSEILNEENFERASSLLAKHGISPKGIAAPTGEWTKSVGTAFNKLNFPYSSEFGYDYNNLPSFPYLNVSFSPVVQLPIHPTCVGTMLRARMTSDDMIKYFTNVIDRNLLLHEPICLYHHPTHKHNEVFDEIFRYINSKNILKSSYSSYAEWWKRRSNVDFNVEWNDGTFSCESSAASDTWLRISLKNHKETIIAPTKKIDLMNIQLNDSIPPVDIPKNIMHTRKHSAHRLIQDILDWWIKTTE